MEKMSELPRRIALCMTIGAAFVLLGCDSDGLTAPKRIQHVVRHFRIETDTGTVALTRELEYLRQTSGAALQTRNLFGQIRGQAGTFSPADILSALEGESSLNGGLLTSLNAPGPLRLDGDGVWPSYAIAASTSAPGNSGPSATTAYVNAFLHVHPTWGLDGNIEWIENDVSISSVLNGSLNINKSFEDFHNEHVSSLRTWLTFDLGPCEQLAAYTQHSWLDIFTVSISKTTSSQALNPNPPCTPPCDSSAGGGGGPATNRLTSSEPMPPAASPSSTQLRQTLAPTAFRTTQVACTAQDGSGGSIPGSDVGGDGYIWVRKICELEDWYDSSGNYLWTITLGCSYEVM